MTATKARARSAAPTTVRTREIEVPFTLTRADDAAADDGLTFEGYAAVFNSVAHVRDQDGEYDEVIAPGAFAKALTERTPVLMFNHGKHPLIGNMPLGKIIVIREDARGVFVQARLTDNWLIQPVRDAIADGAIPGMSFRAEIIKGDWTGKPSYRCRYGELRTMRELRVPELGPVVMPSYSDTTASVRSALTSLEATVPALRFELIPSEQEPSMTERSDDTFTVIQNAVDEAVEEALGIDDWTSDVWIVDMSDTWAVFMVDGALADEYVGYWQVDYTFDAKTVTATVSEPRPVKRTYSDRDQSASWAAIDRAEVGTSNEAARERTSGEAAVEDGPVGPITPEQRPKYLRQIQLARMGITPKE